MLRPGSWCEGCGQPAISATKAGRPICADCVEEGYGDDPEPAASPGNWQETVNELAALQAELAEARARIAVLEGSLERIRDCTAQHGGAAEALRIIKATLAGKETT
jgi:hypothetical protein